MKTMTYLPIGTSEKHDNKLVEKGDILELCTGEKVTFMSMRRTKFEAVLNKRPIIVPIYRNSRNFTPYVLKVIGKDKSVITKSIKYETLKFGQLFTLEGHKETFMFKDHTTKAGKMKIVAIDLASKKVVTIGEGFVLSKVDLNKLKKEMAL